MIRKILGVLISVLFVLTTAESASARNPPVDMLELHHKAFTFAYHRCVKSRRTFESGVVYAQCDKSSVSVTDMRRGKGKNSDLGNADYYYCVNGGPTFNFIPRYCADGIVTYETTARGKLRRTGFHEDLIGPNPDG